jgi:hypothetical protein
MGAGKDDVSPRGCLRPWGGDKEARHGGGKLDGGRDDQIRFQEDDLMTAVEELASVLQGVDDLTYLGQEKGGVRFVGMLGVLAGRESGKRGFRMTSFYSSSPQIQN